MNDQAAHNDAIFGEIHRLATACLEGTATPATFDALAKLVESDPAARQMYIEYLDDTMCLRFGASMPSEWEFPPPASLADVQESDANLFSACPAKETQPPSPRFFARPFLGAVGYFSQEAPLGFLIATVLLALLLVGLWLTPISKSPAPTIADSQQTPSAAQQTPATGLHIPATAKSNVQFVGRITGEVDCRWNAVGSGQWAVDRKVGVRVGSGSDVHPEIPKSPNPKIPNSLVAFGDKFTVASGLMEITFDSGARVILEGPCTFRAETNGGFLSIGRLTGRLDKKVGSGQWIVGSDRTDKASSTHTEQRLAPASTPGDEVNERHLAVDNAKPQAASPTATPTPTVTVTVTPTPTPFVIATPTALVTDLGTEFGVEVNRAGETASYVFRGSVKLADLSEPKKSEIILAANESAHVECVVGPSHQKRLVVRRSSGDATMPTQFVRTLPSPQSVNDNAAYGRLVLSMNPAVYYRMEMPKDPKQYLVLRDSAPGHHDGVIHFAEGYIDSHPYVYGRFGTALRLRGPMLKDYAIVEDYPKAKEGKLTVSAWVLAMGRSDPAIIGCNWILNKAHRDQGQFVLYLSIPTEYNFAGRGSSQDGEESIAIEGQSWETSFNMGTWQHVAQVFDGTTMRIYRNGVQVAERPCRGVSPNPAVKSLSIGCEEISWIPGKIGFWQGAIDEFAIFNHALSAEEIQRLYRGR